MDPNPSATVIADLAAEVEIPADGTLSRVLYNDESMRVVIFAFDADQELTEHSTPSAAILQVVSGRLALDLGDGTVNAGPGAWIRMAPGLPHSVRSVEPSIMLLTMLRGG